MQLHRRSLWLLGTLVVAGLFGCEPPPPPPPPPVVVIPPVLSASEYHEMKAQYLKANPDSLVGRVEGVLASKGLLLAGDLPVKEFIKGDIVSIVNRNLALVADGTVVNVDGQFVYVKYVPPLSGAGREPLVGDIVVRAGKPDRSNYR